MLIQHSQAAEVSYLVSYSGECGPAALFNSSDLTAFYSTKQQGVAYARTDIGGIYKLNPNDTWTPLTDWVGNANWGDLGPDALALDPTDAKKVYVATGEVTRLNIYFTDSYCSRHVHQQVGSK